MKNPTKAPVTFVVGSFADLAKVVAGSGALFALI
jgi:hypothetical protein